MKKIYIPYSEARVLINEADILLFRGQGWISKIIQLSSDGSYSHVGLATWNYNKKGERVTLECVEFREFIGSRVLNLRNYVDDNDKIIDVFRANSTHAELSYNSETKQISTIVKTFNPWLITSKMREMTGISYGWKRIWYLAKFHLLGFRFFQDPLSYDDTLSEEDIYPVCSTVIAWCYQKFYTDLTKFRSSERMEPSDISRANLLNYLFTIVKDPVSV